MTFEERFWAKVARRGPDDCWMWTAGTTTAGYGHIADDNRKMLYAHRVSYEMHSGEPVPKGLVVMHACDTPGCVNPRHLSVGTPLDNSRDMHAKGRRSTMCGAPRKLSREAVLEIRENPNCNRCQMAKKHGVTRCVIIRVARGETYREVV